MAKAFLKVDVEPGKEEAVKGAMQRVVGVKQAELTTGEQDIIAFVEAGSHDEVLTLVVNKVRTINGVRRTRTDIVLD